MRLVQFRSASEERKVAIVDGSSLRVLADTETVYQLAMDAIASNRGLSDLAEERAGGESAEYGQIEGNGLLLPPLDHPDTARCLVTGTGLSHFGSADARDRMHQTAATTDEALLTDSMKMSDASDSRYDG